jgi:hypothetical protein
MNLSPLTIRHDLCAGCGQKKFVFTGTRNFCEGCIDQFNFLMRIGRDLGGRELLPGLLADMTDALTSDYNQNAVSPAFKDAMYNYERATQKETIYKKSDEQKKANIAATLTMIRTLCELAPAEAKEAATRAFHKTYDNKYWDEFLKSLDKMHPE